MNISYNIQNRLHSINASLRMTKESDRYCMAAMSCKVNYSNNIARIVLQAQTKDKAKKCSEVCDVIININTSYKQR